MTGVLSVHDPAHVERQIRQNYFMKKKTKNSYPHEPLSGSTIPPPAPIWE